MATASSILDEPASEVDFPVKSKCRDICNGENDSIGRSENTDEYDEVPYHGDMDERDEVPNHYTAHAPDEVPTRGDINMGGGSSDSVDDIHVSDDDSVSLFFKSEEYDKLDEVDSPHADPGSDPHALVDSGVSETDLPSICRTSNYKVKTLPRLKISNGGITSTHTTYFPKKLKDRKEQISRINSEVNSDYYYDMSTFPRGVLTIFNVKDFQKSSGMSDYPRSGTERDADGLCSLFLDLGFIVERYDNPSKNIMESALKVAGSDTKSSCCVCAILTHGEEGFVYATDDCLKIKDISESFRKRCLAGKPKFLLFQACRGTDYMDSIDAVDGPVNNDVALPCEADFLYAYSTVSGYYSWRNSRQGSWFIQGICSIFRKYAHSMDLYRMLTRVNDMISSRKSRTDDKATDDKRQIASIVSQMRKELFFFPPYGPLENI